MVDTLQNRWKKYPLSVSEKKKLEIRSLA